MHKTFWPRELLLGLLPLLLGFEILFWAIYLPLGLRGVADFRQLYTGGYMLRTGHAAEIYDYDSQRSFEEKLIPLRLNTLPVNHLAFEELLFVPFSLLPYGPAYLAFIACNATLLIVCLRLLRDRFEALSERWKYFPLLLLLAFAPISRALLQGQDSIILLTLLAGSIWTLDREKEFLAGLLVGLGLFKFQIVLPIALLFLLWKRWRFSAGFAASSVTAALVSLWLVGIAGAKEYVQTLLAMSVNLHSQVEMYRYGTDPRGMLNLRGLFSLLNGQMPHAYIQVLVAASSLAVLWSAVRQRAQMSLAITAAALVSYHLFAHDASILIIVIAAALSTESGWKGTFAGLLLLLPMPFGAAMLDRGYLAAFPLLGLFLTMVWDEASSPFLPNSGRSTLRHPLRSAQQW